jgi:hypothetical protein
MNITFEADDEVALLEKFLLQSGSGAMSGLPNIADLRSQAETLLKRISSPVRTMIAGEFSAGKSTLANLLVGERLIPTSVLASSLPPIVFRYGESVAASACWWAGRGPVAFDGADFDAIMAVRPDYIVLTVPNPILKRVSIFDTPGTSDPDRESEVLVELSGRAEMIIWCTNAVQAWRESERYVWTQLSPAVTKNGLMAVTHVDLPSVRQGYGRIMARLAKEAGPLFHAVLPIDSLSAAEAAPRGLVVDDATWTHSGGAGLVKGVLDLAGLIRAPDLLAARKFIAAHITPTIEKSPKTAVAATPDPPKTTPNPKLGPLSGLAKPAQRPPASSGVKINPLAGLAKLKEKAKQNAVPEETPAPEKPATEKNDAVAAAIKPSKPQKSASSRPMHPLVADWKKKIDALITLVQGHDDPESSGFMQAASDTVLEVVEAISAPGVLQPETEWLLPQFQDALDTIILMQMESGDDALEDAAMLLLQMSRDLGLIAGQSD